MPSNKLVNLIRLIVFLGPVFLFIDRVYTRGIDLELGIASLRYALERSSDGGVSSIFSVLGYLFSSLAFWLITRLIIFSPDRNKKKIFLDIILIFLSVIGVSILTGGRSTIFILSGFIYTSYYCRLKFLKKPITINPKSLLFTLIGFVVILYYVNYVFQERAVLSGYDSQQYYTAIISHLHGKEKNGVDLSNKSDFYIYSQLTVAYFVHQYWVLQKSIDLPKSFKFGDSTFTTWKTLLSKTKLVDRPEIWYYSGYYIPLIGIFIYSYGLFFGLIFTFILLFLISYISMLFMKNGKSFNSFFWFNISGFIIIFSSILPSTDVLMLPMIVISMFSIFPLCEFISRFSLKLR